MTFNALVAEPNNETWAAIADGIRRQRPGASILRVMDGEQAIRFLFYRGLYTDAPATPQIVVLATELKSVSTAAIVARLRQHPRTYMTPVVVVNTEPRQADAAGMFKGQQCLAVVGLGTVKKSNVEMEVAQAVQDLCYDEVPSDSSKALQRSGTQ